MTIAAVYYAAYDLYIDSIKGGNRHERLMDNVITPLRRLMREEDARQLDEVREFGT